MKIKLTDAHFLFRKGLLMIIMRTFIFLFFTITSALTPNNIVSQNSKIKIKEDKTLTVNEVFKLIKNQTDYRFFYEDELFKDFPKVRVKKGTISTNRLLRRSLSHGNLNIVVTSNNAILIKDKLTKPAVDEQRYHVSGTVIDNNGQPLPGVTVVVKGTPNGTTTDFDGNYEIELTNENSILVYSYIGFVTQEEVVGSRREINIKLSEDTQELEEVVITALGLERDKKALGYAVQEISGEQVQKVKTIDIATALTGKVAGLWIQNSTEFNEAPDIVLRGQNPLIVIDGVPYGNMKLEQVSPDDIESVNVLKGATASALYGSRGASGAIMVTTKKGGNEISVNTNNMFFAGYLALPETHHSYSAGLNGVYSATDYVWGQKLDIGIMADQWNPETKQIENMPLTSRGKNNFKDFLEPGIITNNNITFSSTGENGSIRTSLTHVYNKGQYPNLKSNKLIANVTGTLKLGNKVDISANLGYTRKDAPQTVGEGYSNQGYIYQILMWTGPEYELKKYRDYWITPDSEQNWHYNAWYDNPYLTAYEKIKSDERNMTNVNLTANYEVFKGAKLTGRVGYDFYSNEETRRNPPNINSTRGFNSRGMYWNKQNRGYSINTDLLLNYKKKDLLIKGFDIDVNTGFSMYKYEDQELFASTRGGIVVPGIYSLNNSVERPDADAWTRRKQVNSWLGIASLSYADAVFLDVTGRNDWSSTLATTENSYFYPSAAGSILISKWLKPSWLDLWKVRGSWTLSKKDLGVYETNVNYDVNVGTWGEGYSEASYTSTIKNAVVKPEVNRTWEIGTAAYFFKNRLNLDVAYYQSLNYDRQRSATISSASGFTSTLVNIDETIERRGLEISVNADIIRKEDFTWSVSANWAKSHRYLKELDPIYSADNLWTYAGARLDTYRIRPWLRDPQGNLIHDAGGRTIRSNFEEVIGYSDPDFIWGLTNTITWKNFNFHLSFDGRVGGLSNNRTNEKMWDTGSHPDSDNEWRYDEVVNGNTSYIGEGVKLVSGTATYDQYGNITADDRTYATNDIPISYQVYARRFGGGSFGATNPTYLKLREIAIGYSMPKKITEKIGLDSATIALTAQNVLLWTKEYRFADPDWNSDSDLTSPSQRFVGLNITLSTSTNNKNSKR
ncbi:SusC/RagA family TonB-linked outer membrane protein [Flavivirga spongiicola]|uniref:SusC/RagA family TonB-linked outer membrane protein n=1 Tax=Flavivirga spongiicola TaxID=421621 RepID=A0ABU7XP86_9FLAO|nr:SusC/RagA family TonB-linked outer membrane protein [Flavivirga sp. MEBiC05379]MDO5981907.1 SusC/RagA family TonB-linked outer membrane protein [Flavivirga sp. MEBiC05379]